MLLFCNSLVVKAPTVEAEDVGSVLSLDGGFLPPTLPRGECSSQLPHPWGPCNRVMEPGSPLLSLQSHKYYISPSALSQLYFMVPLPQQPLSPLACYTTQQKRQLPPGKESLAAGTQGSDLSTSLQRVVSDSPTVSNRLVIHVCQ